MNTLGSIPARDCPLLMVQCWETKSPFSLGTKTLTEPLSPQPPLTWSAQVTKAPWDLQVHSRSHRCILRALLESFLENFQESTRDSLRQHHISQNILPASSLAFLCLGSDSQLKLAFCYIQSREGTLFQRRERWGNIPSLFTFNA